MDALPKFLFFLEVIEWSIQYPKSIQIWGWLARVCISTTSLNKLKGSHRELWRWVWPNWIPKSLIQSWKEIERQFIRKSCSKGVNKQCIYLGIIVRVLLNFQVLALDLALNWSKVYLIASPTFSDSLINNNYI